MKKNKVKPTVKTALAYTLAVTSTAAIAYAAPKVINSNSESTENNFILDVEKVDSDTVKVSLDNIEDIPRALQFSLKLDGVVLKEENNIPIIKNLINQNNSDKIITDYTYNKETNTIDVLITAEDSIPKNGNEVEVFELDLVASSNNESRKYNITNGENSEYKYVSNTNKEYIKGVSVANSQLTINTNPSIKMNENSYIEINEGETLQLTLDNLKEKGLQIEDAEDDKVTLEIKDVNDKVIKEFKGTEEGVYDLYITATDSFGGKSETLKVQVKVNAVDQGPTITKDGNELKDVSINAGEAFDLMAGVKAIDINGNSVEVKVTSNKELNLDPEEDTQYTITYTASDSHGRTTVKTITLSVKANKAPVIKGVTDHTLTVGDSFDPKKNVTVEDEDEDIELVVESNVNTKIAGVYKVIYSATDSGNKTTRVQSVVVVNPKASLINSIPVINAEDKVIQLGEEFKELDGVTASDKEDENITEKIQVIKNEVNINVSGKYEVTYSVTDSNGASSIKTIVITVNEPPVINATDKVIKVGEGFDPLTGVTVSDKEDGKITKIEVIKNTVDIKTPGEYEVTYKVEDNNGGETTKTIKVTVKKDVVLAENITINNKINSLYVGGNKILTATINEEAEIKDIEWTTSDENIASIEVIGNDVKVIAKAKGKVTITATTKDGSNKSDSITINIEEYKENVVDFIGNVIDTNVVTPITGSGEVDSPLEVEVQDVTVEEFSEFLKDIKKLDGVLEEKYIDGNFTVYKIKVKNTSFISKFIKAINNEVVDEGYIEIKIPNHLENASLFETKLEEIISKDEVKPEDNNIPVINAEDKVIQLGEEFNPLTGVTASDKEDGEITEIKVVKNTVDTKTSGEYEVTYKVKDSKGGEATKTIKVIVNEPPVINAEDKVIKVGEGFDPLTGVTASDKEDGKITKIEVIKNTVDIKTPGEYEVTYKVEDNNGGETTKTIKVTVKKDVVLAENITINNKINSLYVGGNKILTATINEEAEIKDIEWTTSDENIASIEVIGNDVKVIAKAKGKVTITATTKDGSNKSDSITINIEEYKENVVDFIGNVIDTNVVTPITGSGEVDSPLEVEVQDVTVEEFSEFLKDIKKLDGVLEEKYIDGNFTVYKIKVKNTSFISKFIKAINNEVVDEAYIEIKIPNDLENASLFETKLEEIISKGENKPEDGDTSDDEIKPDNGGNSDNGDTSGNGNTSVDVNTSDNENISQDKNTSGNSNNKLPITGKESIIGLVGVVTTAAGMLLVGKKKKNKK